MNQKNHEQWVRLFDIPETKLHEDGYTIYKIVSTLLHRSFPEASTSLEVWRRYSAILRLHKDVMKLHTSLKLTESPPPYCKPSLIKRFDSEIIESRKKNILILLNYCSKHAAIYSSQQFINFFKDDYCHKKKLSFMRKKRSSISLASTLGVSENSGAEFSLYSQLNETTSNCSSTHTSNEDLNSRTSDGQREAVGSNVSVVNGDSIGTSRRISFESSAPDSLSSIPIEFSESPPYRETFPGLNDAQIAVECSSSYLPKVEEEPVSPQRSKDEHKKMKPSFISYLSVKASPKKDKAKKKKGGSGYLQKAEQLLSKISLKDSELSQKVEKSKKDSEPPCLKSSVCDLGNYRVIGSSDSIILAVDMTTHETVAIKVVKKCSIIDEKLPYFQPSVSFMVPLLRYYETGYAYYLILKYISGGKVWNHLKKFIKQPSSNGSHFCISERASNISCTEDKVISNEAVERLPGRVTDEQITDIESKYFSTSSNENEDSEYKLFEAEMKTSFQNNLAVVECVSCIDHYMNPCYIPDGSRHHQSSLSNIDFHTQELGNSLSKIQTYKIPPHIKCKSLENLEAGPSCSVRLEKFNESPKEFFEGIQSEGFKLAKDSVSIGSDTLSGVSEDFSCSSTFPMDLEIEQQIDRDSKIYSSFYSLRQTENLISSSFDVNSLIENSKKLIADVNRTLEKSKQQIIKTFSSTKTDPDSTEETLPINDKNVCNISSVDLTGCTLKNTARNTSNSKSEEKEGCLVASERMELFSNEGTDVLSFNSAEPGSVGRSEPISNEDWASVYLSAQSNSVSELVSDTQNVPIEYHNLQEKEPEGVACSVDTCSSSEVGGDRIPPVPFVKCGDTKENSSVPLLNESFSLGCSLSCINEKNEHVPEGLVRVWVSQVIMALDSLHKKGIIWRDFNPSNLLLDEGGSILVTYKYSSSESNYHYNKNSYFSEDENDCWILSSGYVAPELFNPVCKATEVSDWWSVGALLFHLLTGKDVAFCFPSGFTSHTQISFPATVSEEAESLMSSLLCADPSERLGSGPHGVKDIKEHPFFIGIEWPQ